MAALRWSGWKCWSRHLDQFLAIFTPDSLCLTLNGHIDQGLTVWSKTWLGLEFFMWWQIHHMPPVDPDLMSS